MGQFGIAAVVRRAVLSLDYRTSLAIGQRRDRIQLNERPLPACADLNRPPADGGVTAGNLAPSVAHCLSAPYTDDMGDDAPRAPRLPTRCPVCKGAVIQRMPNPTPGTVIWFYCNFCKHAWKFRVDDAEHS